MSGGFTGRIIAIDLGSRTTIVEDTDMEAAHDFIGAKGLGARILYDRLPAGTDSLSPENLLMFTTGPLTGTRAQTSGRGAVVTKSPQTGLFLDSHFGGVFAVEMKRAGWDIIIVKGRSEEPVYLLIKEDKVEFKDATEIWGEECGSTHEWLQEIEGDVKTALIGPAGENLVKFSGITIDKHRHAGRGGAGAVMGSKNLKAVAIKGTGQIPLHDPERFKQKALEVMKKVQENDFVPVRREFGTPIWVTPINDEGFIPTENYREGRFDQGDNINATSMQKNIVDKGGACYNCVIACWNRSSIKKGLHKGVSLVGPEYETIALMGTNLKVGSIEDVAYLNERCNELGMDTISLGSVLGFAVEAYEKGALNREDLNGNDIGWGKIEELAKLIDDIANKRGHGASVLAEGVKGASLMLGKDSDRYAVHVKGLEIPGYDPRGTFGMGLAYATSDRGGCHQRAWTVKAELNDPNYERFSFEKKAAMVKSVQDERAAYFSLVLCDFAPISEEDCVALLNLATGFDHNLESYLRCGERIWNLIRLFNLREGMDPSDDKLPSRFHEDQFTKGPVKGVIIPPEEFRKSLQEYYCLRGWTSSGIPTPEKLKELNLET